MSFFDDMSNAFDSAVKFTGDKVSEQKLRFRISSLKSEISKDYETLGRMYHDNLKNGTENERSRLDCVKLPQLLCIDTAAISAPAAMADIGRFSPK